MTVNPYLSVWAGGRWDQVSSASRGLLGDYTRIGGRFPAIWLSSAVPCPRSSSRPSSPGASGNRPFRDRYFQGVSGRGLVKATPIWRRKPAGSGTFRPAGPEATGAGTCSSTVTGSAGCGTLRSGTSTVLLPQPGIGLLSGVEVELHRHLGEGLSLGVGAQASRGRTAEDGNPVDDNPAPSLTLMVGKTLGPRSHLWLHGRTFARDSRAGPTETATPGFATLDLSWNWLLDSRTELRFRIRNLNDKDYPASPDRWAVPAPGRSFLITLMYNLGI